MKRLSVLFIALMLFFSACAPSDNKEPGETTLAPSAAPTEEATLVPTESPTLAPTESPTLAPTEAPDFSALIPKTGRLVDGPIFPEPIKYLVLSGDSSMHYVFNSMGEFLYSFAAIEYDSREYGTGMFTEDGICCWHRLSDNTVVEPFVVFDNMVMYLDWDYDEFGDTWYVLKKICDRDLNNPIEFKNNEITFGYLGGILEFEDGYLVVDREDNAFFYDYGPPSCTVTQYDKDFNRVSTLDADKFGLVTGVYGGKYIIGMRIMTVKDEYGYYYDEYVYSVYTFEGELLMDDVEFMARDTYVPDDELWFSRYIAADYLTDKDGRHFDKELNQIDELPDREAYTEYLYLQQKQYFCAYDFAGYSVQCWGGAYAGIKDKDGNWTFRIYKPSYAEDHNNDY